MSEDVRALTLTEERAVGVYRHLAQKILGKRIKIRLVRREPEGGLVQDATFDAARMELRINLLGHWDLTDPLSPRSLALFFHELAHAYHQEHDAIFIEHLATVAGKGAHILHTEGDHLRELYGLK